MFYLLASGSIVLAILIASAVLDMILTGLAWMCERQREGTARCRQIVSYSPFQERTSGSREIAMVKPTFIEHFEIRNKRLPNHRKR